MNSSSVEPEYFIVSVYLFLKLHLKEILIFLHFILIIMINSKLKKILKVEREKKSISEEKYINDNINI